MKISAAAKKAIRIGTMCSVSYLAVYVARNVLGAVSPQMIENGQLTTENVGTLSSIYFVAYAFGQLINGRIGDTIKTKYMISFGLLLAGVCSFLFSVTSSFSGTACAAYGATGFFLSMIYGPMTKVVAENTEPVYATRCSLGYTFASFLGSPLAGLLATLFVWQNVFELSSILLLSMGCTCFTVFTHFEKVGIIEYNKYQKQGEKGEIMILIKHQIIKFTLIAVITGVVRTTVVFWFPTYLAQYLSFTAEKSALIFTVSTFAISMTTFVAIFLYECLGRNMDLTILIAFVSAAVWFFAVFMCKQSTFNIVFLVLAIMSSNCAATMMYSRYCPSLRDTGMVSSATGYLDFISYMSASMSSKLIANAVEVMGWGKMILMWGGLMILGIIVALPYNKILKVDTPRV